jgi:RimJ/RimL family protein N-acetyltransferase
VTNPASGGPTLTTPRLVLRRFREPDREPFARLNADPQVMRHFPARLDRAQSDALADRIDAAFETFGYGLWAVERTADGAFLGFTGLAAASFEAHFTPCVEIGWRLAAEAWGQGYATEAATAAMTYGFESAGLHEIVSFTTPANMPSRHVMERLGMHRDPTDDFDNPHLPEGHPLRRHVLYRLRRGEWRRTAASRA